MFAHTLEKEYDPFGKDFQKHQERVARNSFMLEWCEKPQAYKDKHPYGPYLAQRMKQWRKEVWIPMNQARRSGCKRSAPMDELGIPAHSVKRPEKDQPKGLPISFLQSGDAKLPYVEIDGEPWFLANETLAAQSLGFHLMKRTDLGAGNRRRDVAVQGYKRPTLVNREALQRLADRWDFTI